MAEGSPMILTVEPVQDSVPIADVPKEILEFLARHPTWNLCSVKGWTVLPPESDNLPEPTPPPEQRVLVGGRR